MIDLRKAIEEYKSLTLILIEKTKNDEELEAGINKRNNILKAIKNSDYNEEEVKKIIEELNILELENELSITIKKEMVKIKKKIENIKIARNARRMYRVNTQLELKLFEKKI